MRTRLERRGTGWAAGWVAAALLVLGLYGCPGDTELAKGDGSAESDGSAGSSAGTSGSGSGGSGVAGRGGSGGGAVTGGSGGGSGQAGSGSAGSGGGGGGGGETCPPGIAIPAICQLCADGGCGEPVCMGGVFTGDFACADAGTGGSGGGGAGSGGDSGDCVHGGCSSQLCVEASDPPIASTCEFREEYACYQAAECARQTDGTCGFTWTRQLAACIAVADGGAGGLTWFATCGDPVCSSNPDPDDPSVPNCTDAMAIGSACDTADDMCETLSCGAKQVCAAMDPIGNFGCPISRARYKRDIEYVDDAQLARLHDEVTSLPLATWEYKHQPGVPQLGFIIDDIEPSPAVAGDRVNVYGYLSMAVAAIQVQQRQLDALQSELAALREGHADPSSLVCGP